MSEKEPIILPPKYYLDYFNYLIEFIEQYSGHLLGEPDVEFIRIFRSLSEDAQCLMIRMVNRKGEFFRLDKLQYEEIEDYPTSLEQLSKAGMITLEDVRYPDIINLFTKGELHQLFPERRLNKLSKEEIITLLYDELSPNEYDSLLNKYTVIHLLVQEQIEFLKLLFFGHYKGMMTDFVVRDVGNRKHENLDHHQFTPWFDSREEAVAVFQLSKWKSIIRKSLDLFSPDELYELLAPIPWLDYLCYSAAKRPGDKLMLLLAEYFEKNQFPENALNFYQLTEKHPSRERQIRILEKLGRLDEAQNLATLVSVDPLNATEQLFARDFLQKQGMKTLRTTSSRIKSSPVIQIPKADSQRVEEMAIHYFEEKGYQGVHAENYLWRGLFGLVFWDELFDHQHASFHHPLQRTPSDLFTADFYNKRKDHLTQKLRKLRSRLTLFRYIQSVYEIKENISNPMVGWHESLLPMIEVCIDQLPLKGLQNVLLEMAKNVKYNSAGFPDLFIWNESTYHFYEIKSPNDHLSSQQLFWIDFFQRNKIKAEIMRVHYQD